MTIRTWSGGVPSDYEEVDMLEVLEAEGGLDWKQEQGRIQVRPWRDTHKEDGDATGDM